MKKTNTILVLVIAVAVNLCTGYSIKNPVALGSFSGSSSSSSAFAHSSSYTFNGPLNHNDLGSLNAGAAAGANAFAGAGAGSATGALAGAVSSSAIGALAGAGASSATGALAGSTAGAYAGSGAIAGESGTGTASSAGSLANSGSGFIGGANSASGANDGVIGGTDNGSACGEGTDCKGTQNSNIIGESTGPIDSGSYKVINNNKYTTGYSSGTKGTHYAATGTQGQATGAGGCLTCKGPFPGPNGSIHDYKLASSVPNKASGGALSVQPGHHSGGQGHATAGSGAGLLYQPSVSTGSLPGPTGSIYVSKPVVPSGSSGSSYHGTGFGSGHISPSLIATFPGPSGSIYDSKPASKGATASAGAIAGAGSHYSNSGSTPSLSAGHAILPGPSGSIYDSKPAASVLSHGGAGAGSTSGPVTNIPSAHPVVGPACGYTPGSPNKNCGEATTAVASGQSATGVIDILPGPSGSIYDSKPADSIPTHGAASGAGAGAGSTSGSVSTIPPTHPVDGPACNYTPGSPNKNCGGATSAVASGQSATGVIGILPGPSGSIYDSKPADSIPAYGVASGAGAGDGSTSESVSTTGVIGILPGPSGSIYDSKPAGSILTHGAASGAGAGAGNTSGTVTNIPSAHPVVGPACSYTPGSSNKNCGGATSAVASGQSATGVIGSLPGPSGSIYDSKPAGSIPAHGAASGTGAGVGSISGSVSTIPSTHPVDGPACSYTPGSSNKNCGGAASGAASGQSTTGAIGVLPGPSGSIYDSKPTGSIPAHGAISGAGAGASAGASAGTGSNTEYNAVHNVPSSHPVVGPVSGQGASGVISSLPGSSESIYDSKPASSLPAYGASSGAVSGAGAGSVSGSSLHIGSGIVSNIPPALGEGPACSFTPGSENKCGSPQHAQSNAGASTSADATAQAGTANSQVHPPSIHPELPSGTYYINKPALPANDIQASLPHSSTSFGGQIPCSDSMCGLEVQDKGNVQAGASSGAYAGSQSGSFVFVDKDKSDQYHSLNHDEAHKSGGIVYENEDGTYHNAKPTKPTYKNAESGGYAVGGDEAVNTGILIGPGTGHLPIEKDAKPFGAGGAFGGSAAFAKGATKTHDKTYGTHGAFGGSAAFASGTANTDAKPFGTQGAFGGSAAFSKSSASAQSSGSFASAGATAHAGSYAHSF